MATKMTTLTCEHCKNTFNRRTAEYTYQRRKHPNRKMFCSLVCATSFYNEASPTGNKNQSPSLMPHPGNQYGQRYPNGMGYYVTRCAKDGRFSSFKTQDDKDAFGSHIFELWEKQQHRCALTGVPLILRDSRGKCSTSNPFNVASLDRIDCSKPYEVNNVQWISYALNLARNNLDNETFVLCLEHFIYEVQPIYNSHKTQPHS